MINGFVKNVEKSNMENIENVNFNQNIITISSKNPICINKNNTIKDTVNKLLKFDIRRLPVIDEKKRLVGIITVTDVLNAFLRGKDFNEKITSITNSPVFCFHNEKIMDVIKKFKFSNIGGFPIVDKNKKLIGLVTEHDIIDFLKGENIEIPIEKIMTKKPFFIKPTNFFDALMSIVNTGYRKLPVVEDNKIIGLLTERQCLSVLNNINFSRENIDFNLKDIMIKDVPIFSNSDSISKIIDYTREYKVGGGLILENDLLKGIVTERDILEKIMI